MKSLLHIAIAMLLATIICACSNNFVQNGEDNKPVSIEDSIEEKKPLPLDRLEPGTTIDSMQVRAIGIDKCFSAQHLPDSIYQIMRTYTLSEESPVDTSQLRYLRLIHRKADGRVGIGDMVCNKAIANDLLEIFRNLYILRYPIERIRIIDNYDGDDQLSMASNNTSCFNNRPMTGSKRPSRHAYGMAVDINPLYNPYVKRIDGTIVKVEPKEAEPYADRADNPYIIRYGDACHREFIKHGFTWGGSWIHSIKDYQHFEHR